MENKQASLLVSMDLSAAFDTVDHEILLDILTRNVGISGSAIQWFKSYLRDRQLRVSINDKLSEVKKFNFSVPQGSCLGPVLFNLYVSTITECIDDDETLLGYADDHCLMTTFDPSNPDALQHSFAQTENTLAAVTDWMSSNRLKMNPDKSEAIIFKSGRIASGMQTPSLIVSNQEIPVKDEIKYLGVWLDNELSMKKQISSRCQAASSNIKAISSIRRYIDLNTAKLLASSLILCHLDYANCLLCGLPKTVLAPLQRVQNWAAKVTLNRERYSSSTDALRSLHWLPIAYRIDYKIALMVFKCLNSMAPAYLTNLIHVKSCSRTTRSSTNGGIILSIPLIKKSTCRARSFSVYGPRLWNSLPLAIKEAPSLESFKKRLKTHLFKLAFNV
jgi:hypothetical protein